MSHRPFEIAFINFMRTAITTGQLGKAAGCRQVWEKHIISDPASTLWQTAVTGVFEFFTAERERDIGGSRSNGVYSPTKSFRAAGAHVFNPRDRNVRQTQRHRQRQRTRPDVDRFYGGCKPGSLNIIALNTGIS